MVLSERARVLITVKASPEPSEKYGDTVCVAGVRLDGTNPTWIRLYPIPFRRMTTGQQFHKYDVIRADLINNPTDKRSESYKVNIDTLEREGEPIKNIRARGAILEPLIGPTMCDLNAGVAADFNATSLALVRPRVVKRVIVESGKPWTLAQHSKVNQALQQESLFGEAIPPELKAPRFRAKYEYSCESAQCKGHSQGILDWELTALQLSLWRNDEATTKEKIRAKYMDDFCSPAKRPHFFVGNMADPVKRRNFSVLGVYSPPRASDYGATLDFGI